VRANTPYRPIAPLTTPALVAAADNVTLLSNPCNLTIASATVMAFQNTWNQVGAGPALIVDGYYGPLTAGACAQVRSANGGGDVLGPCASYTSTPNAPTPTPTAPSGPHRAHIGDATMKPCKSCGKPHELKGWQHWGGESVPQLKALGQGKMFEAEVVGFGRVHFMRGPKGETLVHGRLGLGKSLGDITDASLVAAAAAVNSLSNPCDWGNSQSTVKAFQSAYNSSAGGTLAVDGYYGPLTAAANSAVATANGGGNVQAGCTAYTDTPTPPATGCASGTVADTVTGACVSPCSNGSAPANGVCPGGTSPGTTPTSSSSPWPWVLGAAGLLAVGGVAYAALKKPSSKELGSAAHKHASRGSAHHKLARHYARASAERAREEAAEARRGRRAA
jgi:peptidoglycan hydrolase-like protein with peptidoglycan-binding domain